MRKNPPHLFHYFAKNLLNVIGIVLIWRGIWVLLDALDVWLFGENHMITAAGGIIVGLLLLFLPDRDLKEIEKL